MKHTITMLAVLLSPLVRPTEGGLVACRASEPAGPAAQAVRVSIDPQCRRSIRGISELRREIYFGLCDQGANFDQHCRSDERYNWLVKDNGITFGRTMGIVGGLDRWAGAIREDAQRPGFIDAAYLREKLTPRRSEPTDALRRDTHGRLDIAAHEKPNAFPAFLGVYETKAAAHDKEPCRLPGNIAAAAELTALTLHYKYTDFDRPAFYELINEPHWSYCADEHLAQWHTATMQAVHREVPGVLVGGPCLPVAYFYKKQYAAFNGFKAFLANTRCELDFYSFHVYDFIRERNGEFGGRITSGLPLESVLDLVQNHTVNSYGREISLVVSEHGGYGAADLVERIAREKFPGSGFDWEMKKRSIEDFNMVSSTIANTLVFMDHPQTIRKAVPFILLEAMHWNPKYWAVLYAPRDYKDRSAWVPTQMLLFYRLFRDVQGFRVVATCPDPDLQVRAFADNATLYVVLNNLSNRRKDIALALPPMPDLHIRRFGRKADYTPNLTEELLEWRGALTLNARETVVIKGQAQRPLTPQRAVDEIPCYGDRIATAITGETSFTVKVPDNQKLQYATLRIGISRPPEAGHEVAVSLNGRSLTVPLEQCAERLVEDEYATCKLIELPLDAVRESNTVRVSFSDGGKGAVGAVVIRAGYPLEHPAKKEQP